jgi:hypothetical protein
MNADSASDEAPPRAFALAAVEKARIPDEWHRQRSAILKLDGELVVRHFDVHRAGGQKVTR